MYHPVTTATTMNRHRVVSVDGNGYWAPGNNKYSTLAADGLTHLTQRDAVSSVLPSTSYAVSSMDHMVLSSTLQQHHSTAADPTMMMPPRRSHRPRGCRGGRKNRKVKASLSSNHDIPPPNSLPYHTDSYDTTTHQQQGIKTHQFNREPTSSSSSLSLYPSIEYSGVVKGDLSPYQHLKLSHKPWNLGSAINGVSDTAGSNPVSSTSPAQHQQMLPPPVPSALFDSHRQNMEWMNQNNNNSIPGSALKMLPSFDEDELDLAGHDREAPDEYYHSYYDDNINDIDDDSSESVEFGMMIPQPPHRLTDAPHHTPSRRETAQYDKLVHSNSHIIPSTRRHLNHSDNCAATVETSGTASSRSRSSSSSSSGGENDEDDIVMILNSKTTNWMANNSGNGKHNNFNSSIHKQRQQQRQEPPPPPPNHTILKSQPPSQTFRLPILHLHITPPLQQQQPTPSRSSTTTVHGGGGGGGGGFGSLFVTSPRSFLFGMGSIRSKQ